MRRKRVAERRVGSFGDGFSAQVAGTESRLLLILDPSCTKEMARARLPAVPVFLRATGCFDVEWKAYFCRVETDRGDAAAATWIFRGERAVATPLRRRGCSERRARLRYVACRDNRVYTVGAGEKRGEAVVRRPHIELETPVAGLVAVDRSLWIATADSSARRPSGIKPFSLAC